MEEDISIWEALYELLDIFQEIEKDNKWNDF